MINRDGNNVGEVAEDLGQAAPGSRGGYLRRKENGALDRMKDVPPSEYLITSKPA